MTYNALTKPLLRNIITLALLLISLGAPHAHAQLSETTAREFGRLPIQHAGRIKPLTTFAQHELLTFYHRSSYQEQSAIAWLAEVLIHPDSANTKPLFRIQNNEVVFALEIEPTKDNLYDFDTLRKGIQSHMDTLQTLQGMQQDDRSLVEQQLIDIYSKSLEYGVLSRSLSAFTPTIIINDPDLAAAFDLAPGAASSYYFFASKHDLISSLLEDSDANASDPRPQDIALNNLLTTLTMRFRESRAQNLAIIPPMQGDTWDSPWALLDGRQLSDLQLEHLDTIQQIVNALWTDDAPVLAQAITDYTTQALPDNNKIHLELIFDQVRFFHKSLYFYIAAFLILLTGLLGFHRWARRLALACLTIGIAFHGTGLVYRMLIMGRPPVSNLYESVIFVGFIAALFGLIIELVRRDSLGLFVACIMGTVFQFIGFRYAAQGDTMGMLVAVLNSNFWLATHVVTITIGYGVSLVAALVGHVYLARLAFTPKNTVKIAAIKRLAQGATGIALLFTMIGTILGGIWADQSWGRFWGWDPKENGALLIVLWLIIILHGQVSGVLSRIGFAAALALTSITVIVAWFGVNLLGVGLHSYGQAFGIGRNIAIFSIIELVLILVVYTIAKSKARQEKIRKQAARTTMPSTTHPTLANPTPVAKA